MKITNRLSIVVLAAIPLGCPGDDTSATSVADSSTSDSDSDSNSNSASNRNSASNTNGDSSSSSDGTTTMTSTTVADSSSTDPTNGSSSTDPTNGSSSTDPTAGSSSSGGMGSSSSGGMMDTCPANDLGNTVPSSITVDTTGLGDTFTPSCIGMGGIGGEDTTVSFTAPAAGTYYFSTARPGTTVTDTVLYLLDADCMGAELACSDDALAAQSLVTVDLAANQTVVAVVDGYGATNSGSIELYVGQTADGVDGGTCCTEQTGVMGCDAAAVEECVCGVDGTCCDTEWTADCADLAVNFCGAACVFPACFEQTGTCDAPADDCSCVGCVDDGACGFDDDCVCDDCAADGFCSNPLNCVDDGSCDPYSEGCVCADCADEDVCGGGTVDACAIGAGVTFTDNVGGAMLDPGTIDLTVDVAGVDAYDWDVTLALNLTHTFTSDVDITLESPSGTIIAITTDNGGGNDNVLAGTTFSDNATTPISDIVFANNVAVASAQPEGAFGAFRGEDPNGTWTLHVGDDTATDSGTVVSWGLTITPANPAPTFDPVVTASGSPGTAIMDNATVQATLDIAGATSICDITVTTDIAHTFPGDLDITLVSPTGTTTVITTNNGGTNDNVFAGTVWDDDGAAATNFVYANLTLASPLAPEGALSTFLGENPTGTWTLNVGDDAGGDVGTLNSWSIDITPCDCQ